ncbi:hypothetical protein VTL71DRAFT_13431 [Oculimacula yallundae]|uniref:Uncharacterized protein n=1 Tax=Oculimacula yallundae TaxID=86028 RepID=A0ABR4CKU4_9HELO
MLSLTPLKLQSEIQIRDLQSYELPAYYLGYQLSIERSVIFSVALHPDLSRQHLTRAKYDKRRHVQFYATVETEAPLPPPITSNKPTANTQHIFIRPIPQTPPEPFLSTPPTSSSSSTLPTQPNRSHAPSSLFPGTQPHPSAPTANPRCLETASGIFYREVEESADGCADGRRELV